VKTHPRTGRLGYYLWVLLVFALATSGARAQAVIGSLEGGPVSITGAVSVVGGKPQVVSGSTIELRGGEARLHLARGGYLRFCGPLRATLLLGGSDALLVTVDYGSVEVRYAARAGDAVGTADFEVTVAIAPGEIGAASANVSVSQRGTMCVNNRGSALRVNDRWSGNAYSVGDAERLVFTPEKVPVPAVEDCGCAPAAPESVPITVAPLPSGQRPNATATLTYPERPQPVAPPRTPTRPPAPHGTTASTSRPATPPPGAAAKPAPANRAAGPNKPKGRGNLITRFFRKLFGGSRR
jgi:hypothetical protein